MVFRQSCKAEESNHEHELQKIDGLDKPPDPVGVAGFVRRREVARVPYPCRDVGLVQCGINFENWPELTEGVTIVVCR
jgi:hypothetical protein